MAIPKQDADFPVSPRAALTTQGSGYAPGASRGVVLLVDDDPDVRRALRRVLTTRGYEISEAASGSEAKQLFVTTRPHAVLLDHGLQDGTALDLLPVFRTIDPSCPILVLTGHGSIDLAVASIKAGAENFLTKPVSTDSLVSILERALDTGRLRRRQGALEASRATASPDPFLGVSPVIREVESIARKVAAHSIPALITGPTGAGKGLLARWIHAHGPRADEPIVELNCAGLSPDLAEAELFGFRRGAFTGAAASKPGLVERAHRGTLFLDEIGDLDPRVQPKLLKALEDRQFRRLGDVEARSSDFRLLSATHQDLDRQAAEGRFRSDLLYRINVMVIRVPGLRERSSDVPLLAEGILRRFAGETGRAPAELAPSARRALEAYGWPGNVRELRNVLERATVLAEGRTLEAGDLFLAGSSLPTHDSGDSCSRLEEVERAEIARTFGEERGSVSATARRLGIPRTTLHDKLRKHGIRH